MVVDEQEFRRFIANLNKIMFISENSMPTEEYEIARVKAKNSVIKYLKILETPKPSKWKQLKLIEHDKINN